MAVTFLVTIAASVVGFAEIERSLPGIETTFELAVGTRTVVPDVATSAPPATLTTSPVLAANPAFAELTKAVGDRVTYPWRERLAGWEITVQPAKGDLLGGTYPYERRIELFVSPRDTVDEVAFTFAHEIAHALDVTYLDMEDRGRWIVARDLPTETPWWVRAGSDFDAGSGDLAESFAVWQVGGLSQSELGGPPTEEQIAVLASMFEVDGPGDAETSEATPAAARGAAVDRSE